MQKKKRIIHLSTPKTWRGGEQQIAYLVEELNKTETVEQEVFCAKGSVLATWCKEKGVAVTADYTGHGWNPFYAKGLVKRAREFKADLIHIHDAHAHNLAILATDLMGLKCPLVLARRVDFPIRDNWFSRYKYRHKSIKKILCVSDAIKKIVAREVLEEKLKTVYSGVDLDRFSKSKKQGFLHAELGLNRDFKLIGNVAALAPHKDYFTFVDAAEALLKERKDIIFLLIGEGGEKAKISAYIREKGIEKSCYFLGFRKDLELVLPELDVFLLSSETEGLCTSILDAFACSVPVVATNAGGVPELVKDGETGLLSKVKNGKGLAVNVNRLLEDKSLRKKVVEGAQDHLTKFSKKRTVIETLETYFCILQE